MIANRRVGLWEGAAVDSDPHTHTPTLPRALSRKMIRGVTAAVIVAGAAIVRAIPWLANYPLHRDEALYGYWARLIASGRDPLLLTPWVDKPPLVPYLLAASVRTFGASELALRAPAMLASLLTILITFGWARRAYGTRLALLAAALLAVSPFAIAFAPTAFTDPWLTLWLMAGIWAALSGHGFRAGLALGLAVASKQQGVLAAPLVLALLIAQARSRKSGSSLPIAPRPTLHAPRLTLRALRPTLHALRPTLHALRPTPHAPRLTLHAPRLTLHAVLGFALVFAPITWWDSLRWSNRPSFWDQGAAAYGGLSLALPAQWLPRAAAWAEQLGYLFGIPLLSAAMLLLAAGSGLVAWRRLAGQKSQRCKDAKTQGAADVLASSTNAILAAFVLGYLALHFFATFQPWDRYLLPILPLVCVLAARGLRLLWLGAPGTPGRKGVTAQQGGSAFGPVERLLRAVITVVLVAALGYAASLGVTGKLPVGSDHGAYTGLDQVVATLRSQPADAIIYHRWLSWHYDFYLFDAPQERRWWDTGWKLAEDAGRTARAEPQRPQWIVFPGWAGTTGDDEAVRLPLASNGLVLTEISRLYRPDGSLSFTLYRIVPLDQGRSR